MKTLQSRPALFLLVATMVLAGLTLSGCVRGTYVKVKQTDSGGYCNINGYRVTFDDWQYSTAERSHGEVVMGLPFPGSPSTTKTVTSKSEDGRVETYTVIYSTTVNGHTIELRPQGIFINGQFANDDKHKIVHLASDGSFTVKNS